MKNDILLLEKNNVYTKRKIVFKQGCAIYNSSSVCFDGNEIRKIIDFVNCLHERYKGIRVPISFEFEKVSFADKLTYIMFEVICATLIERFKHKVFVKLKCKATIMTEGIKSSPLFLLTTYEKQNFTKFVSKFEKELYNRHYRRLLSPDDVKGDKLSKLMDDINSFLKFFSVTDDSREKISEVIIELIGNVNEHAHTDCLVDLDVTENYGKVNSEANYYGINLTVLNFSEKLFYEPLKEKIFKHTDVLDERHKKVIEAYNNHKNFFNENYSEDDFFCIASFQHKISGNEKKNVTGGTGLTKLIQSLEERSDTHRCYILSGNRILYFHREQMEYNDERWIGFNDKKDFFCSRPDRKNFAKCNVYVPGTAYNLNFVMERVDETYGE